MPLHKIETITVSRAVYFVEAPDIETAKHEVCAGYANPATDDFIGEHVNYATQIKRKHFDKWLRHEEELGRKTISASAGLSGDWDWTGGEILRDGKPVPKDETYTYLASVQATPELEVDGEIIACYKMQIETPGWGSDTYWPPEALSLMGASV